ncbi:MAG: hypothetical protein RLY71_1592 [Pseudomonadota bacterium]
MKRNILLALMLAGLTGATTAATYTGNHYTIDYDDTVFGAINLAGPDAASTYFGWSGTLATLSAGAGQTLTQGYGPAFTITADSGYMLGELAFQASVSGNAGSLVQIDGSTSFEFDSTGSLRFTVPIDSSSFASRSLAANYLQLTSQDGGSTSISNARFKINVTAAVPEPTTYAMLLAGMGVIGFMGSRQKKS